MADQNHQIIRVDQSILRRTVEKIIRMIGHVLIERGTGSDHNRKGNALTSTGPACLLPGACDGSRISCHDACFELSYVNAQLECVGTDNSKNVTLSKSLFDLAPLVREIATAITP